MPLIRVPMTLHLTADEDRRKEIKRTEGYTNIGRFRLGLEAAEDLEAKKEQSKTPGHKAPLNL